MTRPPRWIDEEDVIKRVSEERWRWIGWPRDRGVRSSSGEVEAASPLRQDRRRHRGGGAHRRGRRPERQIRAARRADQAHPDHDRRQARLGHQSSRREAQAGHLGQGGDDPDGRPDVCEGEAHAEAQCPPRWLPSRLRSGARELKHWRDQVIGAAPSTADRTG